MIVKLYMRNNSYNTLNPKKGIQNAQSDSTVNNYV